MGICAKLDDDTLKYVDVAQVEDLEAPPKMCDYNAICKKYFESPEPLSFVISRGYEIDSEHDADFPYVLSPVTLAVLLTKSVSWFSRHVIQKTTCERSDNLCITPTHFRVKSLKMQLTHNDISYALDVLGLKYNFAFFESTNACGVQPWDSRVTPYFKIDDNYMLMPSGETYDLVNQKRGHKQDETTRAGAELNVLGRLL